MQKQLTHKKKNMPAPEIDRSKIKKESFHPLDAVTAVDGRYRKRVEVLAPEVSERALIRTRVEIESKYLIALSDAGFIRSITDRERSRLNLFSDDFSFDNAYRVKEIEDTTRHDVKAMERTFRELLSGTSMEDLAEKVHMLLTSEDVNNIAYRLILKRAAERIIIPTAGKLTTDLVDRADAHKDIPIPGRSHGQYAVSTTLGKEEAVFADRLDKELDKLDKIKLTGKLNGAVGNYNAFKAAFPDVSYRDWVSFSKKFVEQFGLTHNRVTTQINTYEDVIEYMQGLQRVNGVMIDLSSDMWRYISDDWLKQKAQPGEVGSSTMPQKVNPIDFENGEGNLHLANDIIKGLSDRLSTSRLQRDLRDSTQIRNIGLILGFMMIGITSIRTGLSRTEVNEEVIQAAVNKEWSVLSEGAQQWLRAHDEVKDPYSIFKDATRGMRMGKKDWETVVRELPISGKAKRLFLSFTPQNYTGFAQEITQEVIDRIRVKTVRLPLE